ncbi:NADP-dependent oxidoreductase domain-containing protein [Pleurostoma richardsiae]|uniref:NADP-dependent oxidoreductase domain-containing protein n=1 Tax=Pleurostoma richardsiae TaxID=41990 RepID=A0AA38VMN3_9PEZI|nr:NADP-dependent oxidoreductase domain-containing protein [Pleurostoma richardsiae]
MSSSSARVPPPTSELARDLTLPGEPAATIPRLIYGTAWKADRTADLVYEALKAGFRAIDTAAQPKHYQEHLVGEGVRRAIAEGIVSRKDLYIQTKFTSIDGQDPTNLPYDPSAPLPDQVRASLASSLASFATPDCPDPYLDCLVLHSPLRDPADTLAVWSTMASLVPHPVRRIGISNAPMPVVHALCELPSSLAAGAPAAPPAVVQNRFYPATSFDAPLRALCRERGVVYQSFWTLTANPRLLQHAASVGAVAEGAGVGAEVALYALVLGLGRTAVLDGTTDAGRMRGDLEGVERVGRWAEGEGREAWERGLAAFRGVVGEEDGDWECGCVRQGVSDGSLSKSYEER